MTNTAAKGFKLSSLRGSLGFVGRWTPITLWFFGVVTLMAALALSHLLSLPGIARDSKLAAGLAELLPSERGGWASIHVLYTECRCSQRIFEHLRSSDRPRDLHEIVLLVGDDHGALAPQLVQRGFEVVSIAEETLDARFGIEGAPAFVLVDPARNVRYSGGYTSRKQGPDISDLAIVREIRRGDSVADLPLFGCAVSQRLKALLDPLAIRR